nr:MAG TPA: hypothetical protein [Caudoviricetes sp.]
MYYSVCYCEGQGNRQFLTAAQQWSNACDFVGVPLLWLWAFGDAS